MRFEIIKKSILIGVLIILLVICYGMDKQKGDRTYGLKKDNSLAIMVYDKTLNDYVAQESVPTGKILNEEKTYCVNGR